MDEKQIKESTHTQAPQPRSPSETPNFDKRVVKYFEKRLRYVNPRYRPVDMTGWDDYFGFLREKYSERMILDTIIYVFEGPGKYWQKWIHTPMDIEKHWDTIHKQMEDSNWSLPAP